MHRLLCLGCCARLLLHEQRVCGGDLIALSRLQALHAVVGREAELAELRKDILVDLDAQHVGDALAMQRERWS